MNHFSMLCATCILTVGATGASAETLFGNKMKDGPFVSYLVGGDVENEGFGFGWQVGYEHNPHLSLEFAAAWNEDRSVELGGRLPGLPNPGAIDLDVLSFALTGRAGQSDPNVYTYVGAGFGLYVLKADNEQVRVAAAASSASFAEADADEEFGAHLAIGVEAVLTEHWELFAEYRHVFFDTGVKVTVIPGGGGAAVTGREELDYDHGLLRLGLTYRF